MLTAQEAGSRKRCWFPSLSQLFLVLPECHCHGNLHRLADPDRDQQSTAIIMPSDVPSALPSASRHQAQNYCITHCQEAMWISWKPSLFYILKYWGFSLSYWLITGICRTFCEFWLIGRFWFQKVFFFSVLCFSFLRKPIHLVNKNEWFMQSTGTLSCPQWTPRLIEWDRFVLKKKVTDTMKEICTE